MFKSFVKAGGLWLAGVCTMIAGQASAQPDVPQLTSAAAWESIPLDPTVASPASILGHELGERFARHAGLVDYFEALAASSDRVVLQPYGHSTQGRPLFVAVISSPENLARLDDITSINRELAAGRSLSSRMLADQPATAWFSFNVHGNEASCSDAAIRVAHTLAAGDSPVVDAILDRAVIVIDPCLNPDGRMRYVNWFQNAVGSVENRDPNAAEHWEPWPQGRSNHYMFDLNRDWVWLIQDESRQRLPKYREFMPQLHIDHHEQGYLNPFFLGAGDSPYNANITPRTRAWIEQYGHGNAQVFDGSGRLYSTRERFDYLYPGYGKVLPVYHGAVGMLIEQAGHSRAGRRIAIGDTRDLTLHQRITNHWLVALSNAEMTAAWRGEQLERFGAYFGDSARDPQPLVVFIDADEDPHTVVRLDGWARAHGVRVNELASPVRVAGRRSYATGEVVADDELPAGTLVVTSAQPMGRLVRAMFERAPELEDLDTYDVTSWSLPVAYGLDATYVEGLGASLDLREVRSEAPVGRVVGDGSVATIVDASSAAFPRVLVAAGRHDLEARLSTEPFTIEGRGYAAGSMVVHHGLNEADPLDAFHADLMDIGVDAHRTATGLTDEGPVLGANSNEPVRHATVGIVRGDRVSSLSFGATWHLFDRSLGSDHVALPQDRLSGLNLTEYETMIVPETSGLPGSAGDALEEWVRDGGVLVALGRASTWAERTIAGLEDDDDAGDEDEQARPDASELTRIEREDRAVHDRIPGSQMWLEVDRSHPLSFGVPMGETEAAGLGWVGVVKRGGRTLRVEANTQVVARYGGLIGGAVSDRNRGRLVGEAAITVHRVGRGRVICFADDLTFRGFQFGPRRLLENAALAGPTLD